MVDKVLKKCYINGIGDIILTSANSSVWADFFLETTWALDQHTVKFSSETDVFSLKYRLGQNSTVGAHFY
jgi:hypothetical protein